MTTETEPFAGPGAAVQTLTAVRARTGRLTDPSWAEVELLTQHSPLMSPLVWDLAHIGQQEEHWLLGHPEAPARSCRRAHDLEPIFDPAVASLYDAFTHPRASRPSLPLLSPAESRRRIAAVRRRVEDLLAELADASEADPAFVAGMVAQHEAQHVETMLATHALRSGPPLLSAAPTPFGRPLPPSTRATSVLVPGGPFLLGADPVAEPWALDNELPQTVVDVPAFRIAPVPVTNGEWLAFVADGGYDDPRWWTPEGWAHRVHHDIQGPLFWERDGVGGWQRRRFGVVEPVPPDEPVTHIDWHEACAYARWAGARLPTEVEWEKVCAWDPAAGRRRRWPWGDDPPTGDRVNLDGGALGPAPAGAYPAGSSAYGVEQLIGDVWEWTSSAFSPWPGFRPMIYEAYSAPFFDGRYRVLRGGSWATAPVAVRPSFRNWDFPIRRQIFTGLRLAWDADPDEV